MRHKLTIFLKNGSQVSGRYSWANVLMTLKFAKNQPDFLAFKLEAA